MSNRYEDWLKQADADVRHSDMPLRKRISELLPTGFPVGMDVFPYTVQELEALCLESPDWHRATTSCRTVYSRTPPAPCLATPGT